MFLPTTTTAAPAGITKHDHTLQAPAMSRILVVACCSLVAFPVFIAITTSAEAHCIAGTAVAGYGIEAAS
eukprot:217301-Rhodomonas_salina.1